jgi:hypothetical protein
METRYREQDFSLASRPGLGRVFVCGACDNVHVTVGPVTLTLTPGAYMQLVELMNTSAANFELFLQQNGRLEGMDE